MKKKIQIRHKYLRFPIKIGCKKISVEIFCEGKKEKQIFAAVLPAESEEEPDFYGEILVDDYIGKRVTVDISVPDDPEEMLPEIVFQQTDELIDHYGKEMYPYIHFAPKCGWMNDPNGLVYYDGKYHMFYQHHGFGTVWEEIGWGHAVSTDLLHWTHLPEALWPDQYGTIYSGSAIINKVHTVVSENGAEQVKYCRECPKDALILCYTSAGGSGLWSKGSGEKFDQRMAYSTDGIHFTKLESPIIPYIVNENRDPKVYWNESSGSYYMALFLDQHDYAVFSSDDLSHWEQTQTLIIPESWECPDLFKVPVLDEENHRVGEKWIFWTADSYYLVGDFDGREFKAVQEIRKLMGCDREDRKAYAAQTFNEVPDRVIQVPWIITGEKEHLYDGIMGLPREVKLYLGKDGIYRLSETPVREVSDHQIMIWSASGSEDRERIYNWTCEAAIQLQAKISGKQSVQICFGDAEIRWDKEEKQMQITGLLPHKLEELKDITVILDKGILEVSCNQDTVLFYSIIPDEIENELKISGCREIRLWSLN